MNIITPKEIVKMALPPFIVFMISEVLYGLWPRFSGYYQVDTPLHFFGGVVIAYSVFIFLMILERQDLLKIKNVLIRILIILAGVVTIAVFWECYEFVHDQFYGTSFQPSNWDTMKDLIMGASGGFLFGLYLVWRQIVTP